MPVSMVWTAVSHGRSQASILMPGFARMSFRKLSAENPSSSGWLLAHHGDVD